MTYNEIMDAAGGYGASSETKSIATYLKILKDKGILDKILPFDQRSWRDIAPTTERLNYEFKRAVNSTMDAMNQQGHLTSIDKYLLQIPSFAGTSNFENMPTSGIGDQILEGFKKTMGSGIEGLHFDFPIEALHFNLLPDDPSDTWAVAKEIINCINPF